MSDVLSYLLVFVLAATPFFEMVPIIPLAVVWGLDLIIVSVLALLGNVLTVILVILLMEQVKGWLQRRQEKKGKPVSSKRQERAKRIWQKYGIVGLSLISPILIGSHLGVVMAMGFGGTKRQTTVYMIASLVLWCVITAVATHLGVEWLK